MFDVPCLTFTPEKAPPKEKTMTHALSHLPAAGKRIWAVLSPKLAFTSSAAICDNGRVM
jgi:hypothetical protein